MPTPYQDALGTVAGLGGRWGRTLKSGRFERAIANLATKGVIVLLFPLALSCSRGPIEGAAGTQAGNAAPAVRVVVFDSSPDTHGELMRALERVVAQTDHSRIFEVAIPGPRSLTLPLSAGLNGRVEVLSLSREVLDGDPYLLVSVKVGVQSASDGSMASTTALVLRQEPSMPESRWASEQIEMRGGWATLENFGVDRHGVWTVAFGDQYTAVLRFVVSPDSRQ